MKIGFLTVGLSPMRLPEIIPWAAEAGFETIEVGCWPRDSQRAFDGTQLDVTSLTAPQADDLRQACQRFGVTLACLTYCDNTLAHDTAKRAANMGHLLKVIDAAALLGVTTVCAFVGRDETLTLADNIALAGQVFRPILDYAAQRNVRLGIENCPMPGWQYEGLVGNVAHTPDVWDRLFEVLPDENFGLTLDPSHLHWLDIDPARAAREYGPRIFHAHAKDTQLVAEQRYRRGIMDLKNGGWRIGRIPGRGGVDFKTFVYGLREGGYNGPLSVELEDPDWWGTCEKVKAGLELSLRYLKPLVLVEQA